jgi:hypothetical protein
MTAAERAAHAIRLIDQGRFDEVLELFAGQPPPGATVAALIGANLPDMARALLEDRKIIALMEAGE